MTTVADWTAALQKDGKFCCLGVLCDIAGVPNVEVDGQIYYKFGTVQRRFLFWHINEGGYHPEYREKNDQ